MTLRELKKEDYLNLKWHFVLLLLCLGLASAAFVISHQMHSEAERQLALARSDLDSARDRLERLERDEDMLAEYRERYREIEAIGVTRPGDRVAMQEQFAQFRARFNLFPIELQIGVQTSFVLPYNTAIQDPGAPVLLQTSEITASLPLLHEDDFARLLTSLRSIDDLLLAKSCSMQSSERSGAGAARNYQQLGQHLRADCSFLWYTLEVQGDTP